MKSKRSRRKQKPQGQDKKPFFNTPTKVQTKEDTPFFPTTMKVSEPNDPLEKEADDAADNIVDKPQSNHNQSNSGEVQRKEQISRQGEEEEAQAKLQRQEEEEAQAKLQRQEEEEAQAKLQRQEEEEAQAKLQRQEEEEAQAKLQRQEEEEAAQAKLQRQGEEEEAQAKLQRKPMVGASDRIQPKKQKPMMMDKGGADKPKFESMLKKAKGKGFKLPDDVLSEMEMEFKADLSKVRIHTDDDAAMLAESIHAQAFTHGYHIFFNKGKYDPSGKEGKRLLAHELAHVVQQKGSKK